MAAPRISETACRVLIKLVEEYNGCILGERFAPSVIDELARLKLVRRDGAWTQVTQVGKETAALAAEVFRAEAATSFTVEDVFHVKGRGPVATRSREVSEARYASGERWDTGDTAVCDETGQVATVVGVERFCVAPGHPAYFDGSLMLRADELVLEVGQTWRRR